MDGRGAWRDNVFVERLWKSVKYEEVYLHAYDFVAVAKAGIGKYFTFFNGRRPHTALDRDTPDSVYFDSQPLAAGLHNPRSSTYPDREICLNLWDHLFISGEPIREQGTWCIFSDCCSSWTRSICARLWASTLASGYISR